MRSAWFAVWLSMLIPRSAAAQQAAGFDHVKHRKLFTTCSTCHAGAAQSGRQLWPAPASCDACHDGVIQKPVSWQPPEPRHSNLAFDHIRHQTTVLAKRAAAGPVACVGCHSDVTDPWMTVRAPVVTRCFACHEYPMAHLAAPDSACATCHVTLAKAATWRREDVSAIDTPPSHRAPTFAGGVGHGVQAKGAGNTIAASCATCHARDFCVTCHVDAPEQPLIQALAPDARSTAIAVQLSEPASHRDAGFLGRHGRLLGTELRQCSTCHTQESCLACHSATPRVASKLPARAPERGIGALITRHPPESHRAGFAERHAGPAAATPATCAGCHARADCLECHRPTAASASAYHPAGFLTRHPVAAYSRETNCSDCHNVGSFCASCHAASGLVARAPLGTSGFHDAKRFFGLGHGQAARQDLESCVGCHVERDCLACHGSFAGRRFNPHGPGFDAARLKRKNPQMCTACHGTNIPG